MGGTEGLPVSSNGIIRISRKSGARSRPYGRTEAVPGRALCHRTAVDPDQAAHMASVTEDNETADNAEAAAEEDA